MTNFILISTLIIIGFSFWDYYCIKRNGNLNGFKKVYHIGLLGLGLALLICIKVKFAIKDTIWYLPLALSLVWLVKDATMGLLIARNLFYLGAEKWDRMWARFPGGLLLVLKLILVGFGIHFLYYHT